MSKAVASRRKDSRTLRAEVRESSARINAGAAAVGVEMARALCPVSNESKPVHLVDTISFEVDEKTGGATMIAGDPERGVDYVLDVEFGHHTASGSYVPGRLFFVSGVEVAKEEGKRQAEVRKPRG